MSRQKVIRLIHDILKAGKLERLPERAAFPVYGFGNLHI
jgi:hypothetical protein